MAVLNDCLELFKGLFGLFLVGFYGLFKGLFRVNLRGHLAGFTG